MTPSPSSPPKLPAWIFIVTDLAFIAAAAAIAAGARRPYGEIPMFLIVACVIAGAAVGLVPLIAHYETQKNEALDDRQRALEGLSRTLTTSAEQISIAASGLNEIAELAQKNLRHAEKLPHQLQDKIAEFTQRLAEADSAGRDELEKEVAALRSSESERLDSTADKITKAAAEWTKLEAAAQKRLIASTETLAKLQADAATLDTKLAAAPAALEARLATAQSAFDARIAAAQTALDTRIAALEALAKLALPAVAPIALAVEPAPAVAPAPVSAPAPALIETPPIESAPTAPESPKAESITHPPKRPRKPRREETAPVEEAAAVAAPAAEPTPAPEAAPAPAPTSTSTSDETSAPAAASLSESAPTAEAPPSPDASLAEPAPVSAIADPKFPEPPPIPLATIPEIAPVAPHSAEPFAGQIAPVAPAAEEPPPVEAPPPAPESPPEAPAVKAARPRAPKKAPAESFDNSLSLDIAETPAPESVELHERVRSSDGATRLLVTAYIGIGNRLFIRGEGPGLSWEKGTPLQFVSIGKWRWETSDAAAPVKFKLYKNDAVECTALGPQALDPGQQQEVTAAF